MPSNKRHNIACIALLCIATVFGCGGSSDDEIPRAAVKGKVTLDGANLEAGIIRFVPTGGTSGPKTSVPVQDGRFSVDVEHGPVIGDHRIEIKSTDHGGYPMDDERGLERLQSAGKRVIEAVRIPTNYNTNSTLTAVVTTDGPNEYEFLLSSKSSRNR